MILEALVKIKLNLLGATCAGLAGFCLATSTTTQASTNTWINPGGGSWQVGTNWSSGTPPTNTVASTNQITNAITKAVTIDATTPAANLTIYKLHLWAPLGFTNTLQLTDLTPNNQLLLLSTLTMNQGGALKVTNSELIVDGSLGGTFNMAAGDVTLDSGLVDCSTTFLTVGSAGSASLTVNS